MTTMIREVYEALKEAGASEEKAVAAAEALADYRDIQAVLPHLATKADVERVEGALRTMRWIIGANLALTAAVLFKLLI